MRRLTSVELSIHRSLVSMVFALLTPWDRRMIDHGNEVHLLRSCSSGSSRLNYSKISIDRPLAALYFETPAHSLLYQDYHCF